MFQQLLESKAARRPAVGGSVVSTAAHAALVTGLVILTAQRPDPAPAVPEPRATFIPVEAPRVAPSARVPSPRSASATALPTSVPGAAPLPIVVEIPIGVPAIDLSVAAGGETAFGPRGVRGSYSDGVPGAAGGGPGSAFGEHEVDKPVLLAPGTSAPAYPASLRAAGLSGMVMVEFVVDTMGRVERDSERIVSTDHALFAASVRATLPGYRFLPAEAQGRRVRQRVRLPFRFSLNP